MTTANSESLSNTKFFLDEEAESELTLSDPHSNRAEYRNISSNITARSLTSFLQTLLKVHKPPSNENCILTLAVEAAFNESKSSLVEEFLQNILCLFELYAISLEIAFAEKRCSSFHHSLRTGCLRVRDSLQPPPHVFDFRRPNHRVNSHWLAEAIGNSLTIFVVTLDIIIIIMHAYRMAEQAASI